MRWDWCVRAVVMAAVVAGSVRGVVVRGAAEPAGGVDLAQPEGARQAVMTGTVAERKAAIEKELAAGDRVERISFTEVEVASALQFLSQSRKIDFALKDEALAKVGVESRMRLSVDLYKANLKLVLEAIRWPMRPTEGGVEWKVEAGVLTLVPVAKVERAVETEAERVEDAAVKGALKKRMPGDAIRLMDTSASSLIRLMTNQLKINVVVDWKELEKAGVDKDVKLVGELQVPTGESVLQAVLGGMKPTKGEVGYEVWGGLVRVSTRERLDKEKPVEVRVGVEGGLP